ncbi:LysR family transcriptional regulator [Vibrio breoganii]
MAKDLFASLDLNLLRTFIILHQERNMRKASERLFVSQPAVSKALQRLRDHFGDELFVKTHHGLRATDFCHQLAESINPIIDSLAIALNQSNDFNPAELDGTIKIALSPFFLHAISSDLFMAIRAEAPNVQVQVLNWTKSTMSDLINDEIQIGLNYEVPHAPKEIISKSVTKESFRAYIRKGHPFKDDQIEVSQGIEFELATIIAADWNSHVSNAEKLLKMRGLDATVGFRSENPSAIIDVVANSDMLFPVSRFMNVDKHQELRSLPILFAGATIEPDVCIFFHNKNRDNQITQWLKSILERFLVD